MFWTPSVRHAVAHVTVFTQLQTDEPKQKYRSYGTQREKRIVKNYVNCIKGAKETFILRYTLLICDRLDRTEPVI